jgi:hypothetical protein
MSGAKAAKRVVDLEEEDHDVNRPPPKKIKQTLQKYKDSYHDLWPCLKASKRGECMVHCTVVSEINDREFVKLTLILKLTF